MPLTAAGDAPQDPIEQGPARWVAVAGRGLRQLEEGGRHLDPQRGRRVLAQHW